MYRSSGWRVRSISSAVRSAACLSASGFHLLLQQPDVAPQGLHQATLELSQTLDSVQVEKHLLQ